jgi:hypothetical protein
MHQQQAGQAGRQAVLSALVGKHVLFVELAVAQYTDMAAPLCASEANQTIAQLKRRPYMCL